jgi:hypothetical protein
MQASPNDYHPPPRSDPIAVAVATILKLPRGTSAAKFNFRRARLHSRRDDRSMLLIDLTPETGLVAAAAGVILCSTLTSLSPIVGWWRSPPAAIATAVEEG